MVRQALQGRRITAQAEGKMIYAVTEILRRDLETTRAQYGHTHMLSKQGGLETEQYVQLAQLAEYHRGRADGLRWALDVIAKGMRTEAGDCKLHRIFA
jgi:hypothetical protein